MSSRVQFLLFILAILAFALYQSVTYHEIAGQNGAGYEIGFAFPAYHYLTVAGALAVGVFALRRSRRE